MGPHADWLFDLGRRALGGRDVPPHTSIFGTEAGRVPSANLELSPPPELKELQPGDFVEADLELLVLPMAADDYDGPNTKLKASLVTTANTWREVHRQAAGNDLQIKVQHGRLTDALAPLLSRRIAAIAPTSRSLAALVTCR